jgi:endo-1,3-1,4-beta-glycanase ExoK
MKGLVSRPRALRLLPLLLVFVAMGVFLRGAIANDPVRISGGKSFFESFETLDSSRWVVANGWVNSPDQGCVWSATNVKLVGQTMSLVLNNRRVFGKNFSCAEIQSRQLYGHGTYEIRVQPAAGSGIISSFFSYAGPQHGAEKSQERWISFDFVGKDLKTLLLGYNIGGRSHRHTVKLAFDPSEGMNDYAMQWTPQAVRWLVNGQLVHTLDVGPAEWRSAAPAKIFVNLRNGTGDDQAAWLGPFEYERRPLVTTYQYIAFTDLDAPCQFPTSVVCKQAARQ